MKNNAIEARSGNFPMLSEKFMNDHPIAATVIYLSPVIIPAATKAVPVIWKGVKYFVDTAADCFRFKVMAENGMISTNIVDSTNTTCDNESIAA